MFDYQFDLSGMKARMRQVFDAQYQVWAGLAFLALAMVAIQYDEVVAPKVHGFSNGFSAIAGDMGRKLTGFTL
jgi:hypothetical protein